MGLFKALVRTTINTTVGLPAAIVKDIATLGRADEPWNKTYTQEQLERIKDESDTSD